MEVYLSDLRAWPVDVVLRAIDRWPERSKWWPAWHELVALIGEIREQERPALPPPAEHRPFRGRADDAADHALFTRWQDWEEFADAMRWLRDPAIPMIARPHLLKIGERIEARQLPNAQARGWA